MVLGSTGCSAQAGVWNVPLPSRPIDPAHRRSNQVTSSCATRLGCPIANRQDRRSASYGRASTTGAVHVPFGVGRAPQCMEFVMNGSIADARPGISIGMIFLPRFSRGEFYAIKVVREIKNIRPLSLHYSNHLFQPSYDLRGKPRIQFAPPTDVSGVVKLGRLLDEA